MYSKILKYLILAFALSMTGIVATISVKGLMTMFPLGIYGFVFFLLIELGKIVSTTALHTYSNTIKGLYKIFAISVIAIGMTLTSAGIYGFLSKAYKESYSNLQVKNTQVEMLNSKQLLLEEEKTLKLTEIENKQKRINTISDQRSSQESRMDSLYAKNWVSAARRVEKAIQQGDVTIDNISKDIDVVNSEIKILNDSINSYQLQTLKLNTNNEAEQELSTLQYLADLTGKSLDQVVSIFILLLVIIGDPQAVLLVIIFNKVIKEEDVPIINQNKIEKKLDDVLEEDLVSTNIKEDVITENEIEEIIDKAYNSELSDEEVQELIELDLEQNNTEPQSSYEKLIAMQEETEPKTAPIKPTISEEDKTNPLLGTVKHTLESRPTRKG